MIKTSRSKPAQGGGLPLAFGEPPDTGKLEWLLHIIVVIIGLIHSVSLYPLQNNSGLHFSSARWNKQLTSKFSMNIQTKSTVNTIRSAWLVQGWNDKPNNCEATGECMYMWYYKLYCLQSHDSRLSFFVILFCACFLERPLENRHCFFVCFSHDTV